MLSSAKCVGCARRGWHIECSAIAHSVFGEHLDLHTGGIDLAFPHHENEIAQCEAAFNPCCGGDDVPTEAWREWCGFFVHTGHLHIAGRKMSKSLKNFISIAEFLAAGDAPGASNAAAFRVFCLLHKYNSNVVYSPERLEDAAAVLKRLRAFFQRSHRLLHAAVGDGSEAGDSAGVVWCERSEALTASVGKTRRGVEAALADDIDTPAVMALLLGQISSAHAILDEHEAAAEAAGGAASAPAGLWSVVRYVARAVRTVGLEDADTLAFDKLSTDAHGGATGGSKGLGDAELHEVVDVVVGLRGKLREAALSKRGLEPKELWGLCDELRDDLLPRLGVAVKDHRDGTASWDKV